MADIFISYTRTDRDIAKIFADAFMAQDWSVWWDSEIRIGKQYDTAIEDELDRAKCVVVLWSTRSVDSLWVRSEASNALKRHVLVPVKIESDANVPLEFTKIETATLAGWKGDRENPIFKKLISSVEQVIRSAGSVQSTPNPTVSPLDSRPFFPGPRPYRRGDRAGFFGREEETQRLLGDIASKEHQTLLLTGMSGVGKSSLMYAGVLPRLPGTPRDKPRNYLYLKPDADPFLSLVTAINQRQPTVLQRDNKRMSELADELSCDITSFVRELEGEIQSQVPNKRILYIDQLEELLVEVQDVEWKAQISLKRKAAFIQGLQAFLDHSRQRNFIVASIRADYKDVMGHEPWQTLSKLFERGPMRWISPPDLSCLDRIVTGPCERAGWGVEPELLKALRLDIEGIRSWTPYLNACLEELVDYVCRHNDTSTTQRLSLDDYRQIGDVRKSIVRLARKVEERLEREQLCLLPTLFRELVRLDHATGKATKQRFAVKLAQPKLRALVDRLTSERLLDSEDDVELAHDTLYDEWPRLSQWIAGNREPLWDNNDFRSRARIWHEAIRGWAQPERKLARKEDLFDEHGQLRLGAHWAKVEGLTSKWIDASQAQILLDVIKSRNPDIVLLTNLARGKVGLDEAGRSKLTADELPFYFALYPERLPESPELPEIRIRSDTDTPDGAKVALADTFDRESSVEAVVGEQLRLQYFNIEHLKLELGVEAGYRLQHIAALGGNVEVLERLRELGADLNAKSKNDMSSLYMAAWGGYVAAVRYLLEQAKSPARAVIEPRKKSKRHCLHAAGFSRSPDVIKELLTTLDKRKPFDTPDDEGWTPLLIATYAGDVESVASLLASGKANLQARLPPGFGLLNLAVHYEHWPLIDRLLELLDSKQLQEVSALGDPNIRTPLHQLIVKWSSSHADEITRMRIESIFERLIEKSFDPDERVEKDNIPLLAVAAGAGALPLVELLLSKGASVDAKDSGEWTALNYALAARKEECARRLLEAM